MTLFEKLYQITDKEIAEQNRPLIQRQVERALASATDSLEGEEIKTQAKIKELTRGLANGTVANVQALLEARLSLQEIQIQREELKAMSEELFAEVKE